jgi:hypothetical protein
VTPPIPLRDPLPSARRPPLGKSPKSVSGKGLSLMSQNSSAVSSGGAASKLVSAPSMAAIVAATTEVCCVIFGVIMLYSILCRPLRPR